MIEALRRVAGEDAVRAPAPAEWRVDGQSARALVQPTSADAVAAVLTLCSEQRWSVEPAGAGTWLDHGCTRPRTVDVLLSTRRLVARVEIEPGDLVAGVDAGVPLASLQQRLAEAHQELPLDPPAAEAATIGAVISHAAAGPLRAGAGTPRDYVLGLQVATGDGQLISFGGRVVKNVAGYDVVRLLTGSRGTLGVITSAWLRLRALPAADRTFVLTGEAHELVQVVAGLGVVHPAAAEVLAPATAAAVVGPHAWVALLRLRGGHEELADAAARLRGLVGGLELTESGGEVWRGLARLEATALPLIRVARLPAEGGRLLAHAQEFIAASGKELREWHGSLHGTRGILRLWPAQAPGHTVERTAAAILELRRRIEAEGGSVLVEGAGALLPSRVSGRGSVDPSTRRLELELKRVMDPAGILGELT